GESWRRNLVAPMLATWGAAMPVAVVHLLPQRLWSRNGLDLHRAKLTIRGQLRPNRRWGVRLADSWLYPDAAIPPGAVPVPVLELHARWLGWGARLITGNHVAPSDALKMLAGAEAPKQAPSGTARPDRSYRQLVHGFVSVASPAAVR